MNPSTKLLRVLLVGGLAFVLNACATGDRREDAASVDADVVEGPTGPTPEARYEEALDLLRRNQFAPAQAGFESLAEEVPERSGPWTNLGILHARAKRLPEAQRALAAATKANPSNAVAHNQLGIALRELRDYSGARNAYETAIALQPTYAAAHLNLGLVLDSHLAEPERALTHYRRYLELEGGQDLRVYVWIAELERRMANDSPAAPAVVTP